MDDPWGSPWSTADNSNQEPRERSKAPSPTRGGLAPPPPAFFSTATLTTTNDGAGAFPGLASFSGQSPWAEDDEDGVGDGASAEPSAAPWAGTTLENVPQMTPANVQKDTVFGTETPIAWPGATVAASPTRKSLARAHSNSPLRQPLPDAWASEWANEPSLGLQGPAGSGRPSLRAPSPGWAGRKPRSGSRGGSPSPLSTPVLPPSNTTNGASARDAEVRDHGNTIGDQECKARLGLQAGGHEDMETRRVQSPETMAEAGPTPTIQSRPSTPGSDESHPHNDQQDSPITSIDEEAKERPGPGRRKASAKVRDLVHMYDGLAKTKLVEPQVPRQERSRSRDPATSPASEDEDEHGNDDFGDFEEAETQADRQEQKQTSERSSRHASRPASPESTPTPKVPKTPTRTLSTLSASASPEAYQTPAGLISPFRIIAEKYGKVTFAPNVKDLDKLFEDGPASESPSPNTTTVSANIPDRIIEDNFTSISERKMWYRISRQGSSYKHDSGDGENYRRVAWPTSTVHDDAMKVVRRWMEEDSITGRATLGGAVTKGTLFGWDSSASEPVSLTQIFAARRQQQLPGGDAQKRHGSHLSEPVNLPRGQPNDLARKGMHSRKMSGAFQSPPQSATLPPAHFGWSSSPVDPPTSHDSLVRQSSALSESKADTTRPFSLPGPPPVLASSQQGSSKSALSLARNTSITALADEEDDDEWGEMVASPAQEDFPSAADPALGNGKPPPTAPLPRTTLDIASLPAPAAKSSSAIPSSSNTRASPNREPCAITDLSLLGNPAAGHRASSPAHPVPQSGLPPSASPPGHSTLDVTETDSAVRQIISHLPDLSYMLR